MIKRIKGVSVDTVLTGRAVTVVFKSPYRWRIYEGDKEVTKEFGFNGRRVEHDDPRWQKFHDDVKVNTVKSRFW